MQLMDAVFVNICDLVDAPLSGREVPLFDSEYDLAEYSKESRKIYPKENAKAGGLLRYLLRRIDDPRMGEEGEASYILANTGRWDRPRKRRRTGRRGYEEQYY